MKPIVVKSFSELNYVLKAGKLPPEQKESHKGTWQIEYNGKVVDYNHPYAVCVNKVKIYKRFGNQFPKPELFKIKPYLIK